MIALGLGVGARLRLRGTRVAKGEQAPDRSGGERQLSVIPIMTVA